MTRREFHQVLLSAATTFLGPRIGNAKQGTFKAFVHPGILHTTIDFERMRHGIRNNVEPLVQGFEKLREHPSSQASYKPHPFAEEIGRNPSANFAEFDSDANAAYQCALMAAITGENRYAVLAGEIVRGWSNSIQGVSGADAVLMASLGPFKFVNAAEILRWLGELSPSDSAACKAMLRRAILPAIFDFAPFANGNWDTAAIKTMLAIAVFCDDPVLFERATSYYLHGDGDGRLTHYIYENGQCQESGRDQQHTQLGLAHMGDACQIAWNQGWDLYGAHDNLLLRGFEYTASYNLGRKVDFQPDLDRTGKYKHKAISEPSSLRPIYEQIFAHYHVVRGLPTPNLAKAVDRLRPEGASQGADHTGFGTLLYARTAQDSDTSAPDVAPISLHAKHTAHGIQLDWLTPRTKRTFDLQRAGMRWPVPGGTTHYTDTHVGEGQLYTYRFSAPASGGFSPLPAMVAAGLPAGWRTQPLGPSSGAADTQFDGKVFTLLTAGKGLLQPIDDGLFVAAPASATHLTVRFIPQVASQNVTFGLSCRTGFEQNAPCVVLLLAPALGDPERHGWVLQCSMRDFSGGITSISRMELPAPIVQYGRLMKPVWLRMTRRDSSVIAAYSLDGQVWKLAGESRMMLRGRVGLIGASGHAQISTALRFELVEEPSHESLQTAPLLGSREDAHEKARNSRSLLRHSAIEPRRIAGRGTAD
ncbi:alginate lyase family protein [Terriglobus albidus]|uniref:alginate lyase family protein n=1 Tax=Terriglobus albidus TaxID=1592106 RepID=UPI0021DFA1E2|nr:alginate lyase family protein [Terriglobus albidus]